MKDAGKNSQNTCPACAASNKLLEILESRLFAAEEAARELPWVLESLRDSLNAAQEVRRKLEAKDRPTKQEEEM